MDLIIDLISEFALSSLLPRGIKTWNDRNYETMINLALALEELTMATIKYAIHGTEHGSNYRVIEIVFNVLVPLLKN
jgi:hypothetical protein